MNKLKKLACGVAVFTGHEHQAMVAAERGKFLLSVPWNANGAHFDAALKQLGSPTA